ncbi:hypothetical protein ACIQXM_02390 [Arthrobacter sp. NPDC097144]|uniref:hypothetical protein n=1 Tax=Arthrobacter sp. NPDC097144 TaxID=3363946 RepID=UPI0037F75A1A
MRISHIPLRLTTGAYILNSGLGKRNLDKESAAGLQQMAGNAFPQVMDLDPVRFGKLLSAAEIAVGLTLLTPFVPSRLAGLVLGAFSGGMVTMYLKTPGLTEDDGIRPTAQGTPLAKDIWMAGIAASLILDRKNRTKVKEVAKVKEVKVPAPVKAGAAAAAIKVAKDVKDHKSSGKDDKHGKHGK